MKSKLDEKLPDRLEVEWMSNEIITSIKNSTPLKRVSNRTRLNTLPIEYLNTISILTQCDLLWGEASVEDLARVFLLMSHHLLTRDENTRIH